MADADPIISRKRIYDDGAILDLRVWRVPAQVRGSSHSFKYRLFYGRPGERLVGYDNEAGKGDHRHYGPIEEAYAFRGVTELLADFMADVKRMRGET